MSKRALKKYLTELRKTELEMQLLDLYDRFPVVKAYYDFVFNPKEDKLLQAAKAKISNEYFPVKRKKPKARRSIAQKYIKHFITLGVDPHLIGDLMLFNIETSQAFSNSKNLQDSFFKSMLNSFNEAVQFISVHGMLDEFKDRVLKIYQSTQKNDWPLAEDFSKAMDILE
ncbi:MAG: DUF6155 family protein [Maribacter sp.]|nr:DUF6155 family protein [Maribacter sp.]